MLTELCVTELEDASCDTEALRSVPQPVVQESSHPYTDDVALTGHVKIPGKPCVAYKYIAKQFTIVFYLIFGITKFFKNSKTGAEALRIEFDRQCSTERRHDPLVIMDGADKVICTRSGREWSDWSSEVRIPGTYIV